MEWPWKGISPDVLLAAGVRRDGDLVKVPYRWPDGSLHRERFFARGGRTWWGPGEGLLPFGLETLPRGCAVDALVIAEGESDALALREAFSLTWDGREISVIGLPGAASWASSWIQYAAPFDPIYVMPDGDLAGRRMADQVLQDIHWARVVWLPSGEDARSLLQARGSGRLFGLIDEAEYFSRALAVFLRSERIEEAEALLRGEGDSA